MRKQFTRPQWQLTLAIQQLKLWSGYTAQREIFDADNMRPFWFDVGATDAAGRLYLFDLTPGYADNRPTPNELEIIEAKKEYCKRKGIFYMVVPTGTKQEMGLFIRKGITNATGTIQDKTNE